MVWLVRGEVKAYRCERWKEEKKMDVMKDVKVDGESERWKIIEGGEGDGENEGCKGNSWKGR